MKILFCNIGWMENYKGQNSSDKLIGGGSFVDENGYGGEVTNFYSINGVYYGYVQVGDKRTKDSSSNSVTKKKEKPHLNLERIEKVKIVEKDFIDNVCIVWISKKPKGKRVIVGWYKHAKVYRNKQQFPFFVAGKEDASGYWFEANKNDCVLIPEEKRNFRYPTGRGFMSTNPYTYADPNPKEYTQNEIETVENYVQSVKNFINTYGKLPQEQMTLDEDLANIESSKESKTNKTQLVNARLGQGKFRKKLLKLYPECPVSKVKLETLLIASHIKPWRDSNNNERLDKFNGFMLAAHIDALFDNGYISFEDDGELLISDLCGDDIDKLIINTNIEIKIYNESKKYLKWHRRYIFKG